MGMLDISSSEESPTCMVCDNADPLYLGDRDAYHIHQCTDCGFYFTHPMPSSNLLSDLYNHYNSNTMYTKKARRKVARVKRRIRRYKHHAPGKRFLDAGCNIGSAVQAAFELGFDAHGVDIGHDGIEIARQIHPDGKYHTGEVASMPQAWAAFDFVYCADVMEHVPDPRALLLSLADRMSRGSILYLDTPDAAHFRVPRNILTWDMVCPPYHLVYFTKKSMRHLLDQTGFDVIKFEWLHKPGLHTIARKR